MPYYGMSPNDAYNMAPTRAGGINTHLNLKKQFEYAMMQNQWKSEQEAMQQRGQMKIAGINQGTYTPTSEDMGQQTQPQMSQQGASSIANGTIEQTPQIQQSGWHISTKTKSYQLSPEESTTLAKSLLSGAIVPSQLSRIQKAQAVSAALQMDPSYNPAQADINFAVNRTGSSNFEKLYNNVTSFEKTFRKNADIALQISENFNRTKIPLVNRAIMAGKLNITGDPEASRFATAVYTVATEYARLTSAPGATGSMITDSAREEARNLLGIYQNQGTIRGQLDPENGIMSIDAKNRIEALNETRNELQSRYGNKKSNNDDFSKMSDEELRAIINGQ